MLNLHESERSKPSSWIPVGWIPHYDPALAPDRPYTRDLKVMQLAKMKSFMLASVPFSLNSATASQKLR